jgi:GNAT superfamily N-acetyltransferase
MPARIEIRPLRPDDDRGPFCSGNEDLDRFFHRYAGQNQFRHHIGVTYVATDGTDLLGFATVAPSEILIDALPPASRGRLPRYPLPVLRLARLAVDQRAQAEGIGRALLRFVLRLAQRTAGELGCVGVVVDAKPEAVELYRKIGFQPVSPLEGALRDRPAPVPMFLPLSAIPSPEGSAEP